MYILEECVLLSLYNVVVFSAPIVGFMVRAGGMESVQT